LTFQGIFYGEALQPQPKESATAPLCRNGSNTRSSFPFCFSLPCRPSQYTMKGRISECQETAQKGTLLRHHSVGTVPTRGQHSHFLFRCPCGPPQYTMKSHKIPKPLCCGSTVSERFRQEDSTSIVLFAALVDLPAVAPVCQKGSDMRTASYFLFCSPHRPSRYTNMFCMPVPGYSWGSLPNLSSSTQIHSQFPSTIDNITQKNYTRQGPFHKYLK
jgi:hypothetical protein